MKANEIPEKIYLSMHQVTGVLHVKLLKSDDTIEYTRTDAFIKMACEKLEKCMYDNLMFQGRLHRKEVIETFIEDFKTKMEEGE